MEDKMCGIYKIISPTKKIYIGQSVNIKKRICSYRNFHCKKQIYLYNSLKKYGWGKHKFKIICLCNRSELNNLEKYYVDLFQTFNSKYGLNLRDGGGSSSKMRPITEEKRKKLSESHKGQIPWNKGKKMSDEQYEKCKKTMFKKGCNGLRTGQVVSEETREKMRIKKIGKKLTKEHKNNISKKMKSKTPSNKGYRKNRKCDINGCDRIHKGHGFCSIHLRLYKKLLLNIGNNNLPEPSKEKILQLITELQKFTIIHNKKNLKRLLK